MKSYFAAKDGAQGFTRKGFGDFKSQKRTKVKKSEKGKEKSDEVDTNIEEVTPEKVNTHRRNKSSSARSTLSHSASVRSVALSTKGRGPSVFIDDIEREELWAEYLYRTAAKKGWFRNTGGASGLLSPTAVGAGDISFDERSMRMSRRLSVFTPGVQQPVVVEKAFAVGQISLRVQKGDYRTFPPALDGGEFEMAVAGLNVESAIKITNKTPALILSKLPPTAFEVVLGENNHIQILENVQMLARGRRNQFAAFIRDEKSLVVWDDDPQNLIPRATDLEKEIIEAVWSKKPVVTEEAADLEKGTLMGEKRERQLLIPGVVACATAMLGTFIGLGIRSLVNESLQQGGGWERFAMLAAVPHTIFFSMFFTMIVCSSIIQLFGPTQQLNENSLSFSAKPPRRVAGYLPHITIQMPVYKESLEKVIDPTIRSVKAAISTYELQGGTASIFVNDDGMQLISEDEADERIDYYGEQGIGWVARPPHGTNGFVRAGRFKKASNMNFSLNMSLAVEAKLEGIERGPEWTDQDEYDAYEKALEESQDEIANGEAWAEGDIRIGDFILIIDSDTRVPEDCFLDAASEFMLSPEVAIIQHASGVMQIVDDFWENGITFFTNLVYLAIRYATAGGDVAAFVGHNAFIRWTALQEVAWLDDDGTTKWWSESHVSEDFEMALKLQILGYTIRLASYHNGDFKEGVSLTVYDELTRWEKYAYGCSELMFHPIRFWLTRGPFTPLFLTFIGSKIKGFSKFTILAYIGTYFAIGGAWLLTVVNYFVIGWYKYAVDKYYVDSWQITLSCLVVFCAAGPFCSAIYRYRIGHASLLPALYENFRWVPLLTAFMGGLSMHVSWALICHLFSLPLSWGATAKELEASNFFKEVPKIARRFKWIYFWIAVGAAMMIYLAFFAPYKWRIDTVIVVLPLMWQLVFHALLPIVLNPSLMTFRF
ncbi:hypothetical protein YB2330_005530 [Saitoella coloradoensis]